MVSKKQLKPKNKLNNKLEKQRKKLVNKLNNIKMINKRKLIKLKQKIIRNQNKENKN